MSEAILPLDPIAIFTHDYGSRSPLSSWPPVPAQELHQGEMLAIHTFGELLKDIRSPAHMYFAAWRDPDPHGYLPGAHEKPPTGIFFSAQFGVAPYETPTSLLDLANMFNLRDRAGLRLDFIRDDEGAFRLDALELQLNDPSSEKERHFRSCWQGDEIGGLDLSLQFDAPATRADPFRFHISGQIPRRYNRGAKIEEERVEFTASGGAMPLPRWVNY